MINQLPRWVWLGGASLAFIAGMINAVGLLSFQHQAVSHLTGTATLLGMAAANSDGTTVHQLVALVASFLLGAILSGIIIRDSALKLGQHYGIALFLESALLFAAVPLLHSGNLLGEYLASCACGLQNAMASTYSGAIIRTTHVSGLVTDLGILLGHLLRGLKADTRRLSLCALLFISFILGAFVSSLLHPRFHEFTLCFPAAFTGLAALGYLVMSQLARRKLP